MLLHIYNQRNTAYSKWKIASERINISLPLEMAADGLAARCRRTSVRCGSKSGAIPASCGSGGQPACLPRAFFFHPKSVQGTFGDFSPAPVKVGQTQSNPVKLWPATRPSRTPDPKPQTRKVGQAGSRSVKLGPAARHPRPKTRNPGPDGQSKRVKPLKPASPCPSKPIKITTH